MELLKILELIPNGRRYAVYDMDNCKAIERVMERRVQGKTRTTLKSIIGTEEVLWIEQVGIKIRANVYHVTFDDDKISILVGEK